MNTDNLCWLVVGYFKLCVPLQLLQLGGNTSTEASTDTSLSAYDMPVMSSAVDRPGVNQSVIEFIPWYTWMIIAVLLVLLLITVVVFIKRCLRRGGTVCYVILWIFDISACLSQCNEM